MKTKNLTETLARRSSLVTGLTVLCLAAVLAVHITLKPIPTETAMEPDDPTVSGNVDGRLGSTRPAGPRPSSGAVERHGPFVGPNRDLAGLPPGVRGDRHSSAGGGEGRPTPRAKTTELTVSVPPNHPRREALNEQAAKVAAYANQSLERLHRQLDLTEEQRARLFPMLAKTSQYYDPEMTLGGAPGLTDTDPTAVRDAIWEALEPAQRDEWVESSVSDMMLWREIFEGLIRQLELATPVPADLVPAAEPTDTIHPGRNLFQPDQAAE